MDRGQFKLLILILIGSLTIRFSNADGSNPYYNDEATLHDVLPMAGEAVQKMLDTLRKNSAILAILPKAAKVALAKEQMKRNEKDLAKFNALPKSTQEKLLGKFLAGNAEARKAFEKNEELLREIGVKFDTKTVLAIAKSKY